MGGGVVADVCLASGGVGVDCIVVDGGVLSEVSDCAEMGVPHLWQKCTFSFICEPQLGQNMANSFRVLIESIADSIVLN